MTKYIFRAVSHGEILLYHWNIDNHDSFETAKFSDDGVAIVTVRWEEDYYGDNYVPNEPSILDVSSLLFGFKYA